VSENVCGLSVNAAHNLLVTCRFVCKIKEFDPEGNLLRDITLPEDVITPWHATQLTSGQFVVCHGDPGNLVHRVCIVSENGTTIVKSHGGQQGSGVGQFRMPRHLAVDTNEFVFVADDHNRRVTLLSPTLNHVRHVVSQDQVKWGLGHLCFDVQRRRLYVVNSEWSGGRYIQGRVVVFSV